MKDNQMNENVSKSAETAGAEKVETAATDVGKFKDVQALWNAYQALEAEFTRRSQRLKELEASKASAATVGKDVQTANAGEPSHGAEAGAEIKPQRPELTEEEKNAVIAEYLNGVFQGRGVPFVTGGGAVTADRRTPKTLKEAGALAGKLFNIKEEN